MGKERIYLDHAASAPLEACAREASLAALAVGGNPSSPHAEGRAAKECLEHARGRLAGVLGCRPRELLFTPSGTEAAQLAMRGAAQARRSVSNRVVLSSIEHPAVSDAADDLTDAGFDVVRVAPSEDGHVDADAFLDAVGDEAAVAALMLANHETGIVNPVANVAAALRTRNIPLLCDACLGPGRLPSTVADLGADLIVLSGHKFGAMRGTGLLYVRRKTPVLPLWNGGLQEEKLVPGTENVVGAAGFAAALEHVVARSPERATRYESQVAAFLDGIEGVRPWSVVGEGAARLPGLITLELPGVEGEAAMINLDLRGIAAATGSSCALGASTPSPSLQAMGWSRERVSRTLRFTFGEGVDDTQVIAAAHALSQVVRRLRSLARR